MLTVLCHGSIGALTEDKNAKLFTQSEDPAEEKLYSPLHQTITVHLRSQFSTLHLRLSYEVLRCWDCCFRHSGRSFSHE